MTGEPRTGESRIADVKVRLQELAEYAEDRETARRVENVLGCTITAPLLAPLDEAEVVHLEQVHGIEFPEEYRSYLLEVSAGGLGPAGELATPAEALARSSNLGNPFPALAMPDAWVGRAIREVWQEPLQGVDQYHGQGVLKLADYGCAMSGLLVVTGVHRGEMWLDDPGEGSVQPWQLFQALHRPIDDMDVNLMMPVTGESFSFLGWIEDWLDVALDHAAGIEA